MMNYYINTDNFKIKEDKNSRKWKLLGSVNGGSSLSLSGIEDQWDELLVYVKRSGAYEILSNVIFKELTDATEFRHFDIGGGYTLGTSGCRAVVRMNQSSLSLYFFYVNSQDKTSTSVTTVYYR